MNKKVELKDIEDGQLKEETINKYIKIREEWQSKIEETYNKMFNKVIDTNSNIPENRRRHQIGFKSKENGLDTEELKESTINLTEMKDLTFENFKMSFKEFAEEVNE